VKNPVHILAVVLVVLATSLGIASANDEPASPSSLERAELLLVAHKPGETIAVLSAYAPEHDEFSRYHAAYGRALAAMNLRYESIEHFRLAYAYATKPADRERLLLERADVYFSMKYFSEASVTYAVFLRTFPKSQMKEQAELGLADALLRTNELRSALEHYGKAGSSARARMGKANTLQALGRTAEANDAYVALMNSDPKAVNDSPETLYAMGENFRLAGKLSDARVYFESVKDPVLKCRASLGLGRIAAAEKNDVAAIAHFKNAMESPERSVKQQTLLLRAEAQFRLKQLDLAKAALLEIKDRYPYGSVYDDSMVRLAKVYRAEGKPSEAVSVLKTLIYRRTPVSAALDEIEAVILEAKNRDHAEFVRLWSAAGRWLLNEGRTKSLILIAQGLRRDGRPFFDICSWLIKYGSDEAKQEGRLLLADFYVEAGEADTAWSFLKRSKRQARSDRALRIEAKIALARKEPGKVIETLTLLKEPTEADLRMLLSAIDPHTKNAKAVSYCDAAFRKMPPSAAAAVQFADLLAAAGDETLATAYYRRAADAPAQKSAAGMPDNEWAGYRLAALSAPNAKEALQKLAASNSTLGHFAAAELKAAELKKRME
jgi:outer membrane protein assembly factor BamD (BamD/ComL family)